MEIVQNIDVILQIFTICNKKMVIISLLIFVLWLGLAESDIERKSGKFEN